VIERVVPGRRHQINSVIKLIEILVPSDETNREIADSFSVYAESVGIC